MSTSTLSKHSDVLVGPSYYAPSRHCRDWRNCITGIKRAWLSMQVSHRGQYSIERALALNEYVRSTSWVRVLFVCVGTPVPVIVLVLVQESIPLQDPAGGWRVNYGIWVRGAIASGVVAHTIVIQLKYLVDGVAISVRQTGPIVSAVMVVYTAIAVVLAANVFFPIPFMTITMTLPFLILVVGSFRLFVGDQVIHEILRHRAQLFRFILFLAAQTLMSVIYPAYQVLFHAAAETDYELLVVALLPIVKLAMRNIIAQCFLGMDDMMPEAVIFTVDFFNAFYIATSMQNASSTATVVVIIAADLIHTVFALRGLRRKVMRQVCSTGDDDQNVLDLVCSLCLRTNDLDSGENAQIVLRSCMLYRLSPENKKLLDRLDIGAERQFHTKFFSNDWSKSQWPCTSKRKSNIQTIVVAKVGQARTQADVDPLDKPVIRVGQSNSLHEVLEILFTSECLVLSEYLEAFVPVLYANYLVVMVHLPSATYHTELTGIITENVSDKVQTVFVYGMLEFLAFVALVGIMQQFCGVRSLHHLAFVLETHMPLIQDKLIAWVLLTLGSRIVHFGVDFTFKFAWVSRGYNN